MGNCYNTRKLSSDKTIQEKEIKQMTEENIITGLISILSPSEQRIINSYENAKREFPDEEWDEIEATENEEEIKDCEIYVNEEKILIIPVIFIFKDITLLNMHLKNH